MLLSHIFFRNISVRSIRAYSSAVKSRIVKPNDPETNCTRSREEFEKFYPKLAAKQKHHIFMLKEMKMPVHRSGYKDHSLNGLTYVSAVALFIYSIYLLVQIM